MKLGSIEEYRALYREEYLQKEIFTYDNVRVTFFDGNFDHIFYREKEWQWDPRFDRETAKRILWIKWIIGWEIECDEYQFYDRRKRADVRSHIFCLDNFFVMLMYDKSKKCYYPVTAYIKTKHEANRFKRLHINDYKI